MHHPQKNGYFKLKYIQRTVMPALLCSAAILFGTACTSTEGKSSEPVVQQTMSEYEYDKQREAIITKHSHNDKTFTALQAQIEPNNTQSSEHWRWRTDQYLYGQYPEFKAIYDAYTQGKSFHDIYDLPPEDLSSNKPPPTNFPALPEGHFSENLPGNPHMGEHYVVGDKIFIVYQGKLTDPYIASYDTVTKQWDGPYKAAESTLSKGTRKIDSHGRPVLEQDAKGHFHIIFGGHGGEREDGLNPHSIDTPHAAGRMLHYMSEKPNDISSFVAVDDITPFASYTASHTMPNGDIYLFTRGGTHKSPWFYYRMKSGNQRFDEPVAFTWPTTNLDDPIHVDTHYIKTKIISDTEIAISYLWHTCNFLEFHDKTNYGRHNVYYMTFDTTTGNFYNVEKEKLTLPITIPNSHKKTLAYDSVKAKETSFGTQPLLLSNGKPAVAYIARGKDYREWRMVSYDKGVWTHSQPMPGTVDRGVTDASGNKISNVLSLETLGAKQNSNKAAVIYRTKAGKTVFAIAVKEKGSKNSWRVDKEYLNEGGTRITMAVVKGKANAVVLNLKKGASQRLYLWQDGAFRPKA